jgi:ZIP family zinc transporter
MTLLLISGAVFCSTLLGGLFALHLKDRLHLILGFSAGAVLSVSLFDLIPESLELSEHVRDPLGVLTLVAVGFALYMIIDRSIHLHTHEEDHHDHGTTKKGLLGAASLSIHSFLDGVGIGFAFQVSPVTGLIVAAAVLAHDFSDGINTVSYILSHEGDKKEARHWLLIDALAPVFGILIATLIAIDESTLGAVLAVFGGFFLYIGASDLLPESHHRHPRMWTTFTSVAAMVCMYIIISYAGM